MTTPDTSAAAHAIDAPATWGRIVFISDLHLGAEVPRTTAALLRWLAGDALRADALFVLGDLFEAWVGDDLLTPEGAVTVADEAEAASSVCRALRTWSDTGRGLFVQHGNRDFLLGADFARFTGARLLPDPTVLKFNGQRLLLTHGDALCLADTGYLAFRAQVRQPAWRRATLAQPLAARAAQARAMRAASRSAQAAMDSWADADGSEAARWLDRAGSHWMIHGHTHRPRDHWQGGTLRQVLSDWDLDAAHGGAPRAQALWIERDRAALVVRRQDLVA